MVKDGNIMKYIKYAYKMYKIDIILNSLQFDTMLLCLYVATPSLTTSLALIKSFAVHDVVFTVHR